MGCFPEQLDSGFEVHSEVDRVMLDDESDNYDVFSSADRNELIFKVFQHLTLGGPLNQVRSAPRKHCTVPASVCAVPSSVHGDIQCA